MWCGIEKVEAARKRRQLSRGSIIILPLKNGLRAGEEKLPLMRRGGGHKEKNNFEKKPRKRAKSEEKNRKERGGPNLSRTHLFFFFISRLLKWVFEARKQKGEKKTILGGEKKKKDKRSLAKIRPRQRDFPLSFFFSFLGWPKRNERRHISHLPNGN